MLNHVKRGIEPRLPLADAVDNWNEIAPALAEGPRQRTAQLKKFFPPKTS